MIESENKTIETLTDEIEELKTEITVKSEENVENKAE